MGGIVVVALVARQKALKFVFMWLFTLLKCHKIDAKCSYMAKGAKGILNQEPFFKFNRIYVRKYIKWLSFAIYVVAYLHKYLL